MNKSKKILALVLAVILACGTLSVVSAAASFNKTEVALESVANTVYGPKLKWGALKGAKAYLVYRKTPTASKWTRIAKVSGETTYVDKAIKEDSGIYYYTVKAADKNGNYSAYSKKGIKALYAQAPVLTKVENVADNALKVSWAGMYGADGYCVYRKTADTDLARIAVIKNGAVFSYTDKDAKKNGVKYTYVVRSFVEDGSKRVLSSYYIKGRSAALLAAPKLEKLTVEGDDVIITWKDNANADYYQIYRACLNFNGTRNAWKKIGKVYSGIEEFVDSSIDDRDAPHLYTVRAFSTTINGSYSNTGLKYEGSNPAAAPTTIKNAVKLYNNAMALAKSDGVKVIQTVKGATNYKQILVVGAGEDIVKGILEKKMTVKKIQEEVDKGQLPPGLDAEGKEINGTIKATAVKSFTCKDNGTYFTVTLKMKNAKDPVAGDGAIGSAIPIITKESVDSLLNGNVASDGVSVQYENVKLVAKIDKATGRLLSVHTDAPSIVSFERATLTLLTVKDGQVGIERQSEFVVGYETGINNLPA